MKIDLDQVLVDIWGAPILESQERPATDTTPAAPAVPMTLGRLVAAAYLTPIESDKTATSVEAKLAIYRGAKLAAAGGVADLSVEQIADMRRRIAAVYHVAVAGPALEVLDGAAG